MNKFNIDKNFESVCYFEVKFFFYNYFILYVNIIFL